MEYGGRLGDLDVLEEGRVPDDAFLRRFQWLDSRFVCNFCAYDSCHDEFMNGADYGGVATGKNKEILIRIVELQRG